MESNGYNTFDLAKILQNDKKIYISLSDCDLNDLKRITQTNQKYLSQYPGSFCLLNTGINLNDNAMATAINMLVTRDIFSALSGNTIAESIANIANTGRKRIYVAVKNMSHRSEFIDAGKKYGVFIIFCRINNNGAVEKWTSKREENTAANIEKRQKNNWQSNDRRKPYIVKNIPEQLNISKIAVNELLSSGSTVRDASGKEYCLIEKVLANNGASTYRTDCRGIWAKIYDPNNLNTFIEAKIKRMLKDPLAYSGISWPLGIVLDNQNTFRGYFVNEALGEPLHLSVFKKAGIERFFPEWTKINLCVLTLTILEKIDYLHKNGVLMGCINPAAIRVVDDKTVYFTDTDNYQIEGFPSFVYNISFTPPELLGKKIYLTNVDSENFSVAELVFMIMMTGKTPYAVGINGDPEREIRKMNFPYSNRTIHGNAALPGMWRFMWSHLTPFKSPFYETFQKNGKFNTQGNRRNTYFWIKLTKEFKSDLENPVDKESLKIYPRTFKRGKNDTFYKCSFCGVEHPRFYFSDQFFDEYQICNDCIDKRSNVSFTCVNCGKTYYYTNRTALFHKQKKEQDASWKDQKHCLDCKRKTMKCTHCGKEFPYYQLRNGLCPDCNTSYRNQVYRRIQCKVCGKMFDFTYGDRDFYAKKGYSLPTKCPECRKGGNHNGGYGNSSYGSSHSSNKGFWGRLFDI